LIGIVRIPKISVWEDFEESIGILSLTSIHTGVLGYELSSICSQRCNSGESKEWK
jgi:hypothetical protein